MNHVLKRMIYGLGTITGADELKPIVWPDFDGESVRLIFDALCNRKTSISVTKEKAPLALTFLDYIGESNNIHVFRSDIEFEDQKCLLEFWFELDGKGERTCLNEIKHTGSLLEHNIST